MKWNKEKIIEYMKDDQEYICCKVESKEGRTIAQNRTYWKIFTGIGQKLWYSKEETKLNILTALFWTYEIKMFWEVHKIPHKTSTTQLSKDEAIHLIDSSLAYAKKIGAWIKIEPREITSLYNTYN